MSIKFKKQLNILFSGFLIACSGIPSAAAEEKDPHAEDSSASYIVNTNNEAVLDMKEAVELETTSVTFNSENKLNPSTFFNLLSLEEHANIDSYAYITNKMINGNDEKYKIIFAIRYHSPPSEIKEANKIAKRMVKRLHIDKRNKISDKTRAWTIVDYLARTSKFRNEKYTAYACLKEGGATCEGYALAFDMMAKYAGLKAIPVSGTYNGKNHMWNLVKIENKYYPVDPMHCDIGRNATKKYFMNTRRKGLKMDKLTKKKIKKLRLAK